MQTRLQHLIDITFQCVLTAVYNERDRVKHGMKELDSEEIATWVIHQLDACGFKTSPCGSSWGVLVDDEDEDLQKKRADRLAKEIAKILIGIPLKSDSLSDFRQHKDDPSFM